MGTLYLIATPLGNLEDITLRALRILGEVSLIATEDTRTTGKLLKHFDIRCPMVSYYEHSQPERVKQILETLADNDVALVSEAGMPLVSDPGYQLVQAAIQQGINVVSLPGPSAVTTALPVSGLPLDQFLFVGFLPRKSAARRRLLSEVTPQKATLVCFEAPHRLLATLADMADLLGADRNIAICRELTKFYEEVWRGTLGEAQQVWADRIPKGEFTLVIAGHTTPVVWDEKQVEVVLIEAIDSGLSTKDATRQVAITTGWSKKQVYALALRLKA
ncbi:MAG: 16S rRNA (cytidine(1402)-2'-O)-methyltransferase [Chloroflexota bacterium]